ncbi:MAG: hypothetical protein LAQ30_08355 [Acidobacteriia bacterium]|nr:hypothetical protein [Terriglobia bacterium]
MKLAIFSICLIAATAQAQNPPGTGNLPMMTLMSGTLDSAGIAPESLITAFATVPNLTDHFERTSQIPFPTTLAGVAVQVTDAAGMARAAGILFVSPGQVNFLMPAGVVPGQATVVVSGMSNVKIQGTTNVQAIAPALFSTAGDGDDAGIAAAVAIQDVIATGAQSVIPVFDCDPSGSCMAVPLQLGVDTPLYLELFGTGIRGRANLSDVSVTIGGQPVPVLYAGPQSQFPGLDQVNVPVLLTLRGAGMVNVIVTVAGQASNPVRVVIQ